MRSCDAPENTEKGMHDKICALLEERRHALPTSRAEFVETVLNRRVQ